MRRFFSWLLVLLLLGVLAAWLLGERPEPSRDYAPDAPMDPLVIAPPVPDDLLPPAESDLPPVVLPSERTEGLPSAPIPYDRLDETPPASGRPAPEARKAEDTIFY